MVSFSINEHGELAVSITGSNDVLTVKNYHSDMFTFQLADGVIGSVSADTAEFAEILSEEELLQSNAELLSDIYTDDSISSDLFTEADSTVISDVSDSVSVADKNEEIADQTDIQVMILTENMSAFSNEDNISESTNITDINDTAVMNQLLVYRLKNNYTSYIRV